MQQLAQQIQEGKINANTTREQKTHVGQCRCQYVVAVSGGENDKGNVAWPVTSAVVDGASVEGVQKETNKRKSRGSKVMWYATHEPQGIACTETAKA